MTKTDITQMNARHGIAGKLQFSETPEGQIKAEIDNQLATASIALQGAHLMTWAPRDSRPVVWLSSAAKLAAGKSIRGGVPICWPWFGPHATEAGYPAHGHARTQPWEVIETSSLSNGATLIALRLIESAATRAYWPHATPLECRYTIGDTLSIELITHNNDSKAVTIGQALHTYFTVSDINKISILGLENCPYLDKVDAFKRKQQTGAVRFSGETDRIYLDSTADCVIEDPGLKRRIIISKKGSRSTVVWTPWAEKGEKMGDLGSSGYQGMVCVESANAADDAVTIPPGGMHRLQVQYRVEARA